MSWNFVGKPDASLYPSDFFRWNVGLQDRLAFHADNFVVDERVSLWLQVSEVCFTKRMSEVIFTGTTNSHIQMTSKIDMCREKEEKEESYVHFVHDHLRVSFVTKVKVRSCRKPCQFFFLNIILRNLRSILEFLSPAVSSTSEVWMYPSTGRSKLWSKVAFSRTWGKDWMIFPY